MADPCCGFTSGLAGFMKVSTRPLLLSLIISFTVTSSALADIDPNCGGPVPCEPGSSCGYDTPTSSHRFECSPEGSWRETGHWIRNLGDVCPAGDDEEGESEDSSESDTGVVESWHFEYEYIENSLGVIKVLISTGHTTYNMVAKTEVECPNSNGSDTTTLPCTMEEESESKSLISPAGQSPELWQIEKTSSKVVDTGCPSPTRSLEENEDRSFFPPPLPEIPTPTPTPELDDKWEYLDVPTL